MNLQILDFNNFFIIYKFIKNIDITLDCLKSKNSIYSIKIQLFRNLYEFME